MVARKRVKRKVGETEGAGPRVEITPLREKSEDREVREINETPGCRVRLSSPLPSSPRKGLKGDSSSAPKSHEASSKGDSRPSDALPVTLRLSPALNSGALSPLPTSHSQTSDQDIQYWRDEEITGHELDPSGDDDGEGINGIGFRPTPAMAFVRQQRRRQQVSEWKVREAREARQRRIERRKGRRSNGGAASGDRGLGAESGREGRVVRFADAVG